MICRSNAVGTGKSRPITGARSSDKVAILAVTRRRRSTFDALMRRLRSRLLLLLDGSETKGGASGISVELEHVLGPSDATGTSTCGCGGGGPSASYPPVLFPTHFVQPRSDVAVFLLRSNGARSE